MSASYLCIREECDRYRDLVSAPPDASPACPECRYPLIRAQECTNDACPRRGQASPVPTSPHLPDGPHQCLRCNCLLSDPGARS